jgi:hypothetical protein
MERMNTSWPVADFDQVRRLRVMAAGVRGAYVATGVVPVPLDVAWPILSDLENEFTNYEIDMRRVKLERSGDRLVARARGRLGFRARFDVDLQPGWCWMQSRFLLIGVAATSVSGGTLVAATGGVRIPGRAALLPIGVRGANEAVINRITTRMATAP